MRAERAFSFALMMKERAPQPMNLGLLFRGRVKISSLTLLRSLLAAAPELLAPVGSAPPSSQLERPHTQALYF